MKSLEQIPGTGQGPDYCLLIVDDDEVDCAHFERLIKNSTLEVKELYTATSLQQARQILSAQMIDCVIVDLNLSDSRGVQTVTALREKCSETAIVVVTGQETAGHGVQVLAGGAQDYLNKEDVNESSLTRAIRFACERKRIQAAWRESEARDKIHQEEIRRQRDFAESLIETAQAIVLVLDTQGCIVRYNPYLEELSGYRLEDKIGQDWFDTFLPSSDRQRARESFARTIRYSRAGGMINPICTVKNRIRYIEWHSRSLKDENHEVIGVLLIGQDITDKKKALSDMQKSKDRLHAVWNSILTGVALIDPQTHTVIDVNPMAEEILGVARDQLIGQTCRELICRTKVGNCPVADLGEECYCSEQIIQCADGRQRFVLKSVTKTTLHGQEYLIDSFIDITDRKEAEKAIRETNAKLEEAWHELKEMHSQVVQSEKLASIGQLAAGVAHEMNTPVGFVASNFETLQSYVAKMKDLLGEYEEFLSSLSSSDDLQIKNHLKGIQAKRQQTKIDFILEDIQELFDESKEGLSRVTTIVQNLRDFSRVDQAEDFDDYNLNEGIQATLVVARNAIKYDADVELHLGEVPPVPCCSGQINQVFLNILVNAAQAINGQGRDERGAITIETRLDGDQVCCRICDDGPGIPEAALKKIFDPFFTTKPAGKGTGLGLSVSYDIIVNKHHGDLSVNSEAGKGTEFLIKLPVKQPKGVDSQTVA